MNAKVAAVMQPYFFPYLGYFHLIFASNIFIHFDDVQFQKKSWMHRNRLLNKGSQDPFYFQAPILKPKYACQYSEVVLKSAFKSQMRAQLSGYRRSPYYHCITELIDAIPDDMSTLVDMNIFTTEYIARKVGYNGEFKRSSKCSFWWEEKPDKGTWGFRIAKEIGADCYVNAIGGESFIIPENSDGLRLGFIESTLTPYSQTSNNEAFISGLSVIDIIANIGYIGLQELINNYIIAWKN